ncbi:unnamed protein product [Linum trigynum]|uniref:Uncharacterized protein n=1 Tax=Linum trigynum TaxID=586398 RepID=A0AAV2CEL2_9ROSI
MESGAHLRSAGFYLRFSSSARFEQDLSDEQEWCATRLVVGRGDTAAAGRAESGGARTELDGGRSFLGSRRQALFLERERRQGKGKGGRELSIIPHSCRGVLLEAGMIRN